MLTNPQTIADMKVKTIQQVISKTDRDVYEIFKTNFNNRITV